MNDRDASKHDAFRRLAARLLEFENIPTTPTTGHGPDIDTPAAWIATSAQTLSRAGHVLARARAEARQVGDERIVTVVQRYEPATGPHDALVVLSVHDFARLITRAADERAVAA